MTLVTVSTRLKARRDLTFGGISLTPSEGVSIEINVTNVFGTDKIHVEIKERFDWNVLQKVIEVLVYKPTR